MMRLRRTTIKRVLAFASGAAVLAGVLALMQATTSAAGKTELHAEFDSIMGLVQYADVTLAGAQVGEVSAIEVSESGKEAVVTLAVDPEVASMLKADASAQVRLKSLLGEQYVKLDAGTADAPLKRGVIENTGTDTTVDELLGVLGGTFGDLSESGLVGDLVDDLNAELAGTGDEMESIVLNSAELIKAISFRSDSVARIITNLDVLTESLDGRAVALGDAIGAGAVALENLRGSLNENVEAMSNAIAQLESALATIETSTVDQALSEIPEWLSKIDSALATMTDLVQGRRPITALLVSIPDLTPDVEAWLVEISHHPLLREVMIGLLEPLCPSPDTPGCGP